MEEQNSNQLGLKIASAIILVSGIFLATTIIMLGKQPSSFILKSVLIAFAALFFGLMGALSFSIYGRKSLQQFSLVNIILCATGFLITTIIIIAEAKNATLYKIMVTFIILSVALAQIAMLYKIEIINKYAAISRVIAIVCITIFSFMLIVLIFGSFNDLSYSVFRGVSGLPETASRSYSALLALDIAFTAATPLLNKLKEGSYIQENLDEDFLQDLPEENLLD